MIDADVMARIAESKIQEAIDEGKFDNLPGKGKPLVFDDDFPPLDRLPQVAIAPEPESERKSRLRGIARERYQGGGGMVRNWLGGSRRDGAASGTGGGVESEDIGRADVPDDMKRS